jgi:hypothetical protein
VIERTQQPHGSVRETARSESPPSPATDVWLGQTVPCLPAVGVDANDDPTILGFPAEVAEDDEEAEQASDAAAGWPNRGPDSASQLVVLRRADRFGALVLVLAGVAAGVSLFLPWMRGDTASGLSLVQRGIDLVGPGVGELARSALWQPLTVVLGGGLLLLLGLLLFLPGRAHRLVGVLALLVAMTAAAAVLVLLADADWRVDRLGLGMWFAVAVPALGLLGALKAMLTAPRVTIRPR